jgi:hypothetical protein
MKGVIAAAPAPESVRHTRACRRRFRRGHDLPGRRSEGWSSRSYLRSPLPPMAASHTVPGVREGSDTANSAGAL